MGVSYSINLVVCGSQVIVCYINSLPEQTKYTFMYCVFKFTISLWETESSVVSCQAVLVQQGNMHTTAHIHTLFDRYWMLWESICPIPYFFYSSQFKTIQLIKIKDKDKQE